MQIIVSTGDIILFSLVILESRSDDEVDCEPCNDNGEDISRRLRGDD